MSRSFQSQYTVWTIHLNLLKRNLSFTAKAQSHVKPFRIIAKLTYQSVPVQLRQQLRRKGLLMSS